MHSRRIFTAILLASAFVILSSFSAQAQKYFYDNFDNNDQGWPFIGRSDGFSILIENSHLVMDGNTTAIHSFRKADLTEETDFAIDSRMIFVNGNHLGWMGIRFMMSEKADKYCSFVYNNDKGFLISKYNGKKSEVIRESKSTVVKPYDYNSLTVIKKGTTYKFLINDKQVHEEKIKDFFGPMAGVITNQNMKMQVDEFQVYDPSKGKTVGASSATILSTFQSGSTLSSVEDILPAEKPVLPADFQEFIDQFGQINYPYYFSPETGQGLEVSNLEFTQKTFYKYVNSNVHDKVMWAMGKLADCKDGIAVLMMNRYRINAQDVSRFIVVSFNYKGEIIGEKEVGAMVKENGSFFKMIDFKAYKENNVVNVEATETFHNGNKQRNSVRFNTAMCNF